VPEVLTNLVLVFVLIGAHGGGVSRIAALCVTLGALEAVLRHQGFKTPPGQGVDAALSVYNAQEAAE
jgi:aspartate aminotransferase-like enzyme